MIHSALRHYAADRKRELSALPNEELRNTLPRLMTLMHSGLIRVYLVAHKVLTTKCLYDTFCVQTLCTQIERESYQLCQMQYAFKSYDTYAFMAN
jgi:hypothetical protein